MGRRNWRRGSRRDRCCERWFECRCDGEDRRLRGFTGRRQEGLKLCRYGRSFARLNVESLIKINRGIGMPMEGGGTTIEETKARLERMCVRYVSLGSLA